MPPLASRQIYSGDKPVATPGGPSHALVHPETGLANDYLNIFNELVMLVEQLPSMTEFFDDVLGWQPVSYMDYFQRSSLPGSQRALDRYRALDPAFRNRFESAIGEIDRAAAQILSALGQHRKRFGETDPVGLERLCQKASVTLRALLNRAATIVNDGGEDTLEAVQSRADRLLAQGRGLTS